MNRRDFVVAGASTIGLAIAGRSLAEDQAAQHTHTSMGATPPWVANASLIDAAADCGRAGRICLAHCLDSLRAADKSMARCSETVSAMLPMCAAVEALAIQGSPHIKALAAVCAKACRECEEACKVHAMHHEPCKRCMETCQRCGAACEKAAA